MLRDRKLHRKGEKLLGSGVRLSGMCMTLVKNTLIGNKIEF